MLFRSGHAGAPVVALHATDVPNQDALMSVGVDLLKKLGFRVTDATSDWGTMLQRRGNKKPIDQGGWSVLIALFSASEFATPAGNILLRGNGKDAWFGWPTDEKMEAMRTAWKDSNDGAARKRLDAEIQLRAFETVPFIPLGQYLPPSGWRSNLNGLLQGAAPVFWNITKT